MIEFSDAHFHSLSEKYKEANIDFNKIYSNLYLGIDCATSIEDTKDILENIKSYNNIYTTVGAGPWDAQIFDTIKLELENHFVNYCSNDKVIAVGEVGLDYHYDYDVKKQKELFVLQIELSIKYKLPLILHIRDSFDDIYDILKCYNLSHQGFVHCCTLDVEDSRKALDMGFYLSFGASSTYKKNNFIRESVRFCPEDRILLETDSPYLPMQDKRGTVNTPLSVYDIGNYLSDYIAYGRNGKIFRLSNENLSRFIKQK